MFLQFPLDSIHPQARAAAEASLCVAQQSAESFWVMHDRLFETVGEWGGQGSTAELFKGYAAELDLDVEAFSDCLESGAMSAQVQAEVDQGRAMGLSGVPAFFVNDWFVSGAQPFDVFQETIDAALRGEHPPPTATPLPPGVTPFDLNPAQPGYTYDGDASFGSEDALVVLVEFVDLQSPENRTHFLEAWPRLKEKYVEPGDVRLIVKHAPAPGNAQASTAAQAAECAGSQGAFWAMYDLLFERQEEWAQAVDSPTIMKGYAEELGLQLEPFSACLDEGQTAEKVERDSAIARENQFPPAPQAFIFRGEQGGYAPVAELEQAIDQLLSEQD